MGDDDVPPRHGGGGGDAHLSCDDDALRLYDDGDDDVLLRVASSLVNGWRDKMLLRLKIIVSRHSKMKGFEVLAEGFWLLYFTCEQPGRISSLEHQRTPLYHIFKFERTYSTSNEGRER